MEPEKWWLEDDPFLLGWLIFRGELLNFQEEYIFSRVLLPKNGSKAITHQLLGGFENLAVGFCWICILFMMKSCTEMSLFKKSTNSSSIICHQKKHQWCLNFKLSEMNVFHVILFIKIIFFNIIFTQILCRIDEIQIGDCWKITVWCPKGEGCLHWIQSLCIWKHWNIIFDSQHECSNTPKPMSYPFISYNLYDILLYQFSTSIYQRPPPHCLIRDGEAPLMIHSTPLGRNRYLCIISMSTNPITLPHTTQIPLPKSGNGMRSFWEGLVLLVPAEIPNILGGSSQDL